MVDRIKIIELMNEILRHQGRPGVNSEDADLEDVGFRSLDFSELALRLEISSGKTLNFDASPLRAIRTVRDVLDFFIDRI